jgi:hypothetical protein
VKDGAHTHRSGGGGLGVAVAIGAGVVLASGIASAIARLLPVLVTGAVVLAGLWIAGIIARAVMIYRQPSQSSYWVVTGADRPGQLTDADPADREIVTLRQAIAELDAQLAARELPGPARHEHLHVHGLAAEQVAAILSAQQYAWPQDGGGEW